MLRKFSCYRRKRSSIAIEKNRYCMVSDIPRIWFWYFAIISGFVEKKVKNQKKTTLPIDFTSILSLVPSKLVKEMLNNICSQNCHFDWPKVLKKGEKCIIFKQCPEELSMASSKENTCENSFISTKSMKFPEIWINHNFNQ